MTPEEPNLPADGISPVMVTEEYLIHIVKALNNLIDSWKMRTKSGTVKLQFAVQIGSKLDREKQLDFMEFTNDTHVPEKYMGKVLHAFATDMPNWAIHSILRIYKMADKTRAAIVMFNDLMDEFETVFQQFEYDFLEGKFPIDHDSLEHTLVDVVTKFEALYNQASTDEKADYNRYYGDSSFSSNEHFPGKGGCSFQTFIGVPEDASRELIRKQSRRLFKKLHPDRGGSAYLFNLVKKAYDAFKQDGLYKEK